MIVLRLGTLCVADDKPRPDFKEDVELALVSTSAASAMSGLTLSSSPAARFGFVYQWRIGTALRSRGPEVSADIARE